MQREAMETADSSSTRTPTEAQPASFHAGNSIYSKGILLQRTRVRSKQPADAHYWTAYDRFMLEREGRAIRRAYLGNLIAGGWRRLRARLAALRLKADPAR